MPAKKIKKVVKKTNTLKAKKPARKKITEEGREALRTLVVHTETVAKHIDMAEMGDHINTLSTTVIEHPASNAVWTFTPVKSSNIRAVAYRDGRLMVCFQNGGVYEYSNVPADVWAGLLYAESVGKFLNESVKGTHTYVKVD